MTQRHVNTSVKPTETRPHAIDFENAEANRQFLRSLVYVTILYAVIGLVAVLVRYWRA